MHGRAPALLSQSLYDALVQLGFRGWLDIDHATEITVNKIVSAIGDCASVIVLMNDETPVRHAQNQSDRRR